MVIYVEYVLIDNMVINSLILLATAKFAKQKVVKWKVALSALLGTLLALISPILPNVCNLAIKPFLAISMILIAFKPKKIKLCIAQTLIFFVVTFAFGGACLAIMEILGIDYQITNGTQVTYNFPVGMGIAVCAVVYVCLKNIIKFCFSQQKKYENVYQLILQNKNKKVEINAFLDTGNCIISDGKPVTIINYSTFNKLFPNISLSDLLLCKNLPLKNSKKIFVKSLGSVQNQLLSFEIDQIECKNKITKDAIVALSLNNFAHQTNSDAIISKNILGD